MAGEEGTPLLTMYAEIPFLPFVKVVISEIQNI
jgi:hypothetical protein